MEATPEEELKQMCVRLNKLAAHMRLWAAEKKPFPNDPRMIAAVLPHLVALEQAWRTWRNEDDNRERRLIVKNKAETPFSLAARKSQRPHVALKK
jgi:hypothetical protein